MAVDSESDFQFTPHCLVCFDVPTRLCALKQGPIHLTVHPTPPSRAQGAQWAQRMRIQLLIVLRGVHALLEVHLKEHTHHWEEMTFMSFLEWLISVADWVTQGPDGQGLP